jgi:histidine triad (HIT) family protein
MPDRDRVPDCLFCRIVAGEIPAKEVLRTDDVVAFRDIDPQAPVHVLVIPTRHVAAARDAGGEDGARLLGLVLQGAAEVARTLGVDASGYRLVANTGRDALQSVDHLHFHLIGGRKMGWPPG